MVGSTVAAENIIPLGGTVFIGEENLDITDSGAIQGASLVWYGAGGKVSSIPAAQVTVADPAAFYASPATFSGKTGPWFLLPENSIAFYIKEPSLELRVVDYSSDFVISASATWVPKGDTVGFRIDTNLWEMSLRPGSTGAPLIIRLTGPGGVKFSSLGGYSLEDVSVSSVPFETGPIWSTGSSEYPSGEYSVLVRCDANDVSDNYPASGKTISEEVTFLLQKDNPLITRTTAIPVTSPLPATLTPSPSDTAIPSPATTLQTTPSTPQETPTTSAITAPPTTVPGFGFSHGIVAIMTVLSLAALKRKIS